MSVIINAKQLHIKNKEGATTHTLDSTNTVIFHKDYTRKNNDILTLKDDKISKLELGTQGQVLSVDGDIVAWKDVKANTVGNLTKSKVLVSDSEGDMRGSNLDASQLQFLNPSTKTESVTLTDNDGFILHDTGTPTEVKLAKISDIKTYILTFSAVTENNSNPSTSAQIKTYVDGEIDTIDGKIQTLNTALSSKQDSLTFGLSVNNSLKVQTALVKNDILVAGDSDVVPLELPQGSILVGDGDKKPKKLSIGTEGQVLTVDGSNDLTWANAQGGGVENGLFSTTTTNIESTTTDEEEIDLDKGIEFFNMKDDTTTKQHKRIIKDGTEGQVVHVLYETAGASLRLDFTAEKKLAIGSGMARFMTFSQPGQSASIVYIGSKWRVLNTGATVSDS